MYTNLDYPEPQTSSNGDGYLPESNGKMKQKPDQAEECLVCGSTTHGMHFQVATCRACAAFFRRSVKDKKAYKCRRGDRNCDLTKPPNGKPICKLCRLQKCYQVGMRLEQNEELPRENSCSDSGNGSPESAEVIDPSGAGAAVVGGNKFDRDISKVVQGIKSVFNSVVRYDGFPLPAGVHSTPFQQLQFALSAFRSEMCPVALIHPSKTYNKLDVYPFQERYARRYAQMLMSCDPFVQLSAADKYTIFKHSWYLMFNLERQYSSCEMFGYSVDDTRIILTDTLAIDLGSSTAYYTGMDPAKADELAKFCQPVHAEMYELLTLPVKQLQMSTFELAYVFGLILFGTSNIRGLSRETKIVGEQLVDQFSTELHNYYTYEKKITNYAPRHARIVRLISSIQTLAASITDYMTMAKIFDIFVTNVYDSELYV